MYIYVYTYVCIYIFKQLYTQTNIYKSQTYTQDANIKFGVVEI